MIVPLLVFLAAIQQEPNLQGTVILPDGTPAAGIEVREASCVPNGFEFHDKQTTDDKGHFAFTVARPQTCCAAYVFAKAPGTAPGWISVEMPSPKLNVVLRLRKPVSLNGHVIDAFGKPIEGAKVSIPSVELCTEYQGMGNIGDYNGATDTLPEFTTTSSSDGGYRFTEVPEGAVCTIHVSAAGYKPIEPEYGQKAELLAGEQDATIAMLPKLSGSATVLLNGRPVPNATVITENDGKVVADNRGSAKFFLEDGVGYVWARSPDGKLVSDPVLADVTKPGKSIQLELKPAALIKGKLVGFAAGTLPKSVAITHLDLSAGDANNQQKEDFPVADDGTFSVWLRPQGEYNARAGADFSASGVGGLSFAEGEHPTELVVTHSDDIDEHPQSDIRCKVVDKNGNPVDGARVIAIGEGWYGDTVADGTTTTKAQKGHSIIATNAERTQFSAPLLYKGQNAVELKLASAPILSGIVADDKGAGIPFADIDVVVYGDNFPAGRSGSEWFWIEADREGKYKVAIPAAAELRLGFKAPGYVERYTDRFRMGHTSTVRPADMMAKATQGLKGIVVDGKGKAVPGVPVQINWMLWEDGYTINHAGGSSSGSSVQHPKWLWAYTKADGSFEFPKFWNTDDYWVTFQAEHPYFGKIFKNVKVGETAKIVLTNSPNGR